MLIVDEESYYNKKLTLYQYLKLNLPDKFTIYKPHAESRNIILKETEKIFEFKKRGFKRTKVESNRCNITIVGKIELHFKEYVVFLSDDYLSEVLPTIQDFDLIRNKEDSLTIQVVITKSLPIKFEEISRRLLYNDPYC